MDQVVLMGKPVGTVTEIVLNSPMNSSGKVFVGFVIDDPYFGYIWSDSKVTITKADSQKRLLSVTEGTKGQASYRKDSQSGKLESVWDSQAKAYMPISKYPHGFYIPAESQQ